MSEAGFECPTPPDLRKSAKKAKEDVLPQKSKARYEKAYKLYKKWCLKNGVQVQNIGSENVTLAYFRKLAKEHKTTLWPTYSMLRATLNIKDDIDISKCLKLRAFLKKENVGYQPKRSSVFSRTDIERFLKEAPIEFLPQKVALIIGVSGACPSEELFKMKTSDIDFLENKVLVVIPNTKAFVITNPEWIEILRRYMNFHKNIKNERLLMKIRYGTMTKQPIGHNTIAQFPKKIASFLNLTDVDSYTGHSFRRTAATLEANSVSDFLQIKNLKGRKLSAVADGQERIERILSTTSGSHSKCSATVSNSAATASNSVHEDNFTSIRAEDSQCTSTPSKDSLPAPPNLPEENDEESLGIITFNSDPAPPEHAPDKPMPLIRVRPVSSLQKAPVRTLNHELFPSVSSESSRGAPPLVMPSLTPLPPKLAMGTPPVGPPVVLNSKMAVAGLLGPMSSRSDLMKPKVQRVYPKARPTKLVPVTIDYMKKMGVNPLKVRKLKSVSQPRNIILPGPPPLLPKPGVLRESEETCLRSLEVLDSSQESNEVTEEMRSEEDAIDIKDEPLDLDESDLLNELGAFDSNSNGSDDSDGETTRSASETSLMDKSAPVTDNLSQLIGNEPDIADEQFDHPEYVHINNVTFADLTKLMNESKQLQKEVEGPSNADEVPANTKPRRPKTKKIRTIIPKQKLPPNTAEPLLTTKENATELPEQQTRPDTEGPLLVPKRGGYRSRIKPGKRLRLVPVDPEEAKVAKRRRSKVIFKVDKIISSDQNNVCVLYTNFTSDGDYINDHDYLVNPYMRNNMSGEWRNNMGGEWRKVDSCLCCLCDWVHPANMHVEHMRCHSTRCAICCVDFHNVFILNLHVRCHTSQCRECGVNVTYARYRHHAETHNRSLVLTNIDLPPDNLIQPDVKDEPPAPSLLKPRVSGTTPKPGDDDKSNVVSPTRARRMTRNSRARDYETPEVEEEEACIYDKATKSFITPSLDKQQKLLAKCNAQEKDTKKAAKDEAKQQAELQSLTLTNLLKSSDNLTPTENPTKEAVPAKPVAKKRRPRYSGKRRKRIIKGKRQGNIEKAETVGNDGDACPEEAPQEVAPNEGDVKQALEPIRAEEIAPVEPPKPTRTNRRKKEVMVSGTESLTLPEEQLDDANAVASIGTSEPIADKKAILRKTFSNTLPGSRSNAPRIPTARTNKKFINTAGIEPTNTNLLLPSEDRKTIIHSKRLLRRGHNKPKVSVTELRKLVTEEKRLQAKTSLLTPPSKSPVRIKCKSIKTKDKGLKLEEKQGVISSGQGDLKERNEAIELVPVLERLKVQKKRKGQELISLQTEKTVTELTMEVKESEHIISSEAKQNENDKKPTPRPRPSESSSGGSRSSRSRGSLNLVEGLKIDGPVRAKKPRISLVPSPEKQTILEPEPAPAPQEPTRTGPADDQNAIEGEKTDSH